MGVAVQNVVHHPQPSLVQQVERTTALRESLLLNTGVWRLWPPMFAGVVASGMLITRNIVTLAELGWSPSLIGLFSATLYAAMFIGAALSNPLQQRIGMARTYKIGVVFSLLALIGFSMSNQPAVWFASNLMLGFSFIGHWIIGQLWIVSIVPERQRGRALSMDQLLGGGLYALNPVVLALVGVNSPTVLPVIGLLILISLIGTFPLRVPPANEPKQEKTGSLRLRDGIALAAPLLLVAFLSGIAENGSNAILPVYGIEVGMGAEQAALLVTAVGIGNVLVQIPIGLIADRLSSVGLRRVTLLAVSVIPMLLVLLPFISGTVLVWPLLLFLGMGFGSLYTLALVQAGKTYGVAQLGPVIALMASTTILGSMTGPTVSGIALSISHTLGLTVSIGSIMLVATVVLTRLYRRFPVQP